MTKTYAYNRPLGLCYQEQEPKNLEGGVGARFDLVGLLAVIRCSIVV